MIIFDEYKNIKTLKLDHDQLIFHEGDECLGIYLVQSGKVVIKNIFKDGKEYVLRYLEANDIFGDILLFSNNNKYPASIYALEDNTIIKYVDKADVISYMNQNPSFNLELLNRISNHCYDLNDKVKLLSKKSIRSKLSYYLLRQASINKSDTFTLCCNREKLALLLNIERPSLSRELIKLKNEGIIDFYLQTIKILNKAKLKDYL